MGRRPPRGRRPRPRTTGEVYAFGPEVVHAMGADEAGGLTLHVYAPPPGRTRVFDLANREVLLLGGDHGAWIPAGDHERVPFTVAATAGAAASPDGGGAEPAGDRRPVIWVAHTTRYRGGSASFAVAAETMARRLRAEHPEADVQVAALVGKADFAAEMARLVGEGCAIAELHFVGHAGMYGPMFGSVDWPEQFSPHEWRTMAIPFAPDGRAWFHACRTARWFAPFFARTFGVTTYGNQDYTTVSAHPERFAWAGRHPERRRDLYLVATPGRRSHGLVGSIRKYRGVAVDPMIECVPAPPDATTSYDRVAELYDRAYVDIRVREAEWSWVTARADEARAELGRPLRLVEVGCGNGALLRALDDRGDVADGLGLDDSVEMVARARDRSAERARLRFDRIVGPVIDAPDDSADVFVSFLSFRYLDWDPLMAEVRRVLAPGGRIWIVDLVAKPVQARDLPLLARSTAHHLGVPRRRPEFARDLEALTSHPDWKAMVRHNPIRAEHEYRWYLESRFPGRRLEVLTVTAHQRVVAFDSGPVAKGVTAPLSYP
ncbi:MAG: class I SAM-dependent methyltransferase [Acidimicrobiales bacterium]